MSKCFLLKQASNSEDLNSQIKSLISFKDYEILRISELLPKVEEINLVKQFLLNSSYLHENKVLIFENFDQVSVLNQNKLLKLIEENNPNTSQFYIVSNPQNVIDTVKSRLLYIELENKLNIDPDLYAFFSKYSLDMNLIAEVVSLNQVDFFTKFESQVVLPDYRSCFLILKQYKLSSPEIIMTCNIILYHLAQKKDYRLYKSICEYEKKISLSNNKIVQLRAMLVELM